MKSMSATQLQTRRGKVEEGKNIALPPLIAEIVGAMISFYFKASYDMQAYGIIWNLSCILGS